MNKQFWLAFLMMVVGGKLMALDPTHFTVTRITAPFFVDDHNGNNLIKNSYVGFEVKNNSNSGVTYSRLKFSITDIVSSVVGTNYSVVGPSNGTISVGTLAPGQSKVCYFYVSYPTGGDPVATFTTVLSDQTATSKTSTFSIYNRNSISANAGGLSRQSVVNQNALGGIFIDDILYTVGNVRNGDEVDFQATISPSFNPTAMQLISTQVIASSVPGIRNGTTDSLYFITGQGRTGDSVKVRWTFRIVAPSFKAYMLPYAGATSGSSNYKFQIDNALGTIGDSFAISSPTNAITITKRSDKRSYTVCDTAQFRIVLKNTTAYGLTIDSIKDQLPSNFTYIYFGGLSQLQSSDCMSEPTTGSTGHILFTGGIDGVNGTSFFVPSNDSLVLIYLAKAPCTPQGDQTTQVSGYVGPTMFDVDSNTVNVVPPLPHVPVAVNDSFATPVDVAISGNLASNDTSSIDGGNVWSLLTIPSNGLVSVLPDGTFTYTPTPGFAGLDTFYYKVCDVDADCDTAFVVVRVNDVPVAVSDSMVTNVNTAITNASVANNDTPSVDGGNVWSVVSSTSHGSLTFRNDGTFDYTPNTNYVGSDTFYYRIVDANGDADTAMVVIHVSNTTSYFDLKLSSAIISSGVIEINWDVTCETGIMSYQLERSTDGIRFDRVTETPAASICINHSYKAVDNVSSSQQVIYYRVKISETNGRIEYSKIIRVNLNKQNEIALSPNPFTDQISIELKSDVSGNATIQIVSVGGKMVYSEIKKIQQGTNNIKLNNLSALPKSSYFVNVYINGKLKQGNVVIK